MATITPPQVRVRNLNEYHQRVRSPLARLRGYIRSYVGIEGGLLLVLLTALWFWIGLSLDYGFFKLFAIDWVQEWPWAVRLVLLLLVSGAVLAVVSVNVFGRLFRDFSDASLALVLERRFPKLLGDRLITAVELSDLRQAEEQGYSPAMVLETIHEAAERVQEAPVQQAFDWRRLIRRGVVAALLTLGLYLLVGGLFLMLDALWRVHAGRTGYSRFNETAQIWFERNILLQNTIWPRQAQLEFVNFPNREVRIGFSNKVPPLRIRAIEYAIADSKSDEGWRALTWKDLQDRHSLGVGDVADQPFNLTPRDPAHGLTVDEVALQLRKFDVRAAAGQSPKWLVADAAAPDGWRPLLWSDLTAEKLDGLQVPSMPSSGSEKDANAELTVDDVEKTVAAADRDHADEAIKGAEVVLSRLERIADVDAVLQRVNGRAALPEMSRTMRRLDVPDIIYLKCTGDKTFLRNELHKQQDNEYTGNFGELKESVVFTVQADDYYTPRRYVTLVPAPTLIGLDVEEERPAYLYYRPTAAATLSFLRGKKQPFQTHDVLQAGSETSRIDVPAGTDLVLRARSDKPLREAFLKGAKNLEEIRLRVDPTKLKTGAEAAGETASLFGPEMKVIPVADAPGVVVVRPVKAGDLIRLPLDIGPGGKDFLLSLPNLRQDLVFDFEFTDADNVKGKRKVVIKPQDDTPPELTDVQLEYIRKATLKVGGHDETYFLVTRKARIPITAKIHDDHMLGDVRVRYSLNTAVRADVNAILTIPSIGLSAPAGGLSPFAAAAYLSSLEHEADSYAPPRFAQIVRDAQDDLPLENVKDLLAQPQLPPFRQLVHDVDMKPDEIEVFPPGPGQAGKTAQDNRLDWDFPLWKLQQLQNLEDNHPPYRMDLWLEATDTDADEPLQGGEVKPHLSKSKETFAFLIVPESQLLAKIGEDEVKQYVSMNKRCQDLQEKAGLMDTGINALNGANVQVKDLLGPSTRAEKINEDLENTLATTREVLANYQRMVKEEELNVVSIKKITDTQDTIVAPLKEIIDLDFPAVLDANAKFRKALDDKGMSDKDRIVASEAAGKDVSKAMATLLKDLNAVLEVMRGIGDLQQLIDAATIISRGVHDLNLAAVELQHKLEDNFFDNPTPKKP
jgi:hypothetical protein